MQADLSKKDEQFREFSLNGPMWRVVLYVGFPLALYESTEGGIIIRSPGKSR